MVLSLLTSGYDYNLLAQLNRCRVALGLTEVGSGASLDLFDQINQLRYVLGLPLVGAGSSSDLIKEINDLIAPINESSGGSSADAVHWDGASSLRIGALNCGDHDKISFAVWFRSPIIAPNDTSVAGFFATDPEGTFPSYSEADFLGSPSQADGGVQFSLGDPASNFLASSNTSSGAGIRPLVEIWYAYMWSADCSSDIGPLTAYLNDSEALGFSHNLSAPASTIAGNGVPLWVGVADTLGDEAFDMANFLMWYGQVIDWSVEANRRFIVDASGKAVDPALAIAHFGTPTVAFIGDATAFQTNQGSGGSFTLSGSLTDASTSPSN